MFTRSELSFLLMALPFLPLPYHGTPAYRSIMKKLEHSTDPYAHMMEKIERKENRSGEK